MGDLIIQGNFFFVKTVHFGHYFKLGLFNFLP